MAVTCWLAREKIGLAEPQGPHPYALMPAGSDYVLTAERAPLRAQRLGDDVTWEADEPAAVHRINAALWHAAGGMRLKPGDGPVLVRLELVGTLVAGAER